MYDLGISMKLASGLGGIFGVPSHACQHWQTQYRSYGPKPVPDSESVRDTTYTEAYSYPKLAIHTPKDCDVATPALEHLLLNNRPRFWRLLLAIAVSHTSRFCSNFTARTCLSS